MGKKELKREQGNYRLFKDVMERVIILAHRRNVTVAEFMDNPTIVNWINAEYAVELERMQAEVKVSKRG